MQSSLTKMLGVSRFSDMIDKGNLKSVVQKECSQNGGLHASQSNLPGST